MVLNFLSVACGDGWGKHLLFYFYSIALMNHSCCPNVIVTYKGTLAEVRAVREIEPGEEVNAQCLNVLCTRATLQDPFSFSGFISITWQFNNRKEGSHVPQRNARWCFGKVRVALED